MRKITDKIIVLLACIAILLYLVFIMPFSIIEFYLFKTHRISEFFADLVKPPHRSEYAIDDDYPLPVDRTKIYTPEMYEGNKLPPFYFTQEYTVHKSLYFPHERYRVYDISSDANGYLILIDLLNRGILTSQPPQI